MFWSSPKHKGLWSQIHLISCLNWSQSTYRELKGTAALLYFSIPNLISIILYAGVDIHFIYYFIFCSGSSLSICNASLRSIASKDLFVPFFSLQRYGSRQAGALNRAAVTLHLWFTECGGWSKRQISGRAASGDVTEFIICQVRQRLALFAMLKRNLAFIQEITWK